jgi:hypothetical protein
LRFPQEGGAGGVDGEGGGRELFFAVQASTAPFELLLDHSLLLNLHNLTSGLGGDFKLLSNSLLASPRVGGGSDSSGGFLYLPGFAVSTTYVGLKTDVSAFVENSENTKILGGLDRLFPKAAFSRKSVSMHLAGFLAIEGCEWPSTENMIWVLDLEDSLLFCDNALVASSARSIVELHGILNTPRYSAVSQPSRLKLHEDVWRNSTLKVLLSSIRLQSVEEATVAAAIGRGTGCGGLDGNAGADSNAGAGAVYQMRGTIEIVPEESWDAFLGQRWLEMRKCTVSIDLEIVYGSLSLKVSGENSQTSASI